jgi:hypothetical protein
MMESIANGAVDVLYIDSGNYTFIPKLILDLIPYF